MDTKDCRTWKDLYFSSQKLVGVYRTIAVLWMDNTLVYAISSLARSSGWSMVGDLAIMGGIAGGLALELYGWVWRRGANKIAEVLVEEDA